MWRCLGAPIVILSSNPTAANIFAIKIWRKKIWIFFKKIPKNIGIFFYKYLPILFTFNTKSSYIFFYFYYYSLFTQHFIHFQVLFFFIIFMASFIWNLKPKILSDYEIWIVLTRRNPKILSKNIVQINYLGKQICEKKWIAFTLCYDNCWKVTLLFAMAAIIHMTRGNCWNCSKVYHHSNT